MKETKKQRSAAAHKVGKKRVSRRRSSHSSTHVLPAHLMGKSLTKKAPRKRG